jgi:hypothetical protein
MFALGIDPGRITGYPEVLSLVWNRKSRFQLFSFEQLGAKHRLGIGFAIVFSCLRCGCVK